ncbi:helix-turn-helix domain-containing protein [Sandarakinorhabdus sp.]|uniref:helix-turn-helix domain-containing protein n=1 Tax=Sandarakinorhabdus sp. TaxID=1916663 RepID=UPI00333ED9AD
MHESIAGFYTVAEFIRLFGLPRSSLYRLVKQGKLRIHKIGRASRIAKSEAASWAAGLPTLGGETRP